MQRPVTSKSRGICRYYNTPRGCFAGDNCKFLHGEQEKLTPYDKNKTCRYFAAGYCKRGEKCWFRHVTPANTTTANTSEPPICAICMEVPVTFGLLVDCSHVFCIDCIRMWRGQGNSSDDLSLTHVHKTCPYCRIPSKYVIPSSHFYPDGHPGKAHIIEQYKESLQRVSCKYFAASNPENRFCPFGKDCLYQHLNEDGTCYVFERGADYYMLQRDRRLPGFRDSRSFREVLTRSIYGWLPMDSIFGIPELVADEFASDVDWALERTDTESESDGPAHLEGINTTDSQLDTSRPETSQSPFTFIPSNSTISIPTLITAFPVPVASHTPTSLNLQPPDPLLHSIPSSPSSMPSLQAASDFETDGDVPDVANTSSQSVIYQDEGPSQPINESITDSDRMPPCQSHTGALSSPLSYAQRADGPNNGTSMPASPVPLQRDDADFCSPLSPQAPQIEVSSVTEVGVTASSPSSTGDPPGGISDTRQPDPPFMTDGRGRVVWSCSGVKRGGSPPPSRNRDRTPSAAGERE